MKRGGITSYWGVKTKFGCYANVRELCSMKQCLNCHKEFEYKRESAKFCSDKCRATYNRAHPKQLVTPIQMQVLYNAFLEAVGKIQYSAPKEVYDAPKKHNINDEPLSFDKINQTTESKEPSFQELLNGMAKIIFADEKNEYAEKIHSCKNLTDKQRQILLNSLYYK